MSDYEPLYRILGYRFEREHLLTEALTHRSVGGRNYERLEFLGDGILNFVVAALLFERHPKASEGELSRLRASLVKGEQLARIARGMGLGEYLILGPGELKSGGFRRDSILADALESILGAMYLDAGFEVCNERIRALFDERMDELPHPSALKDPKTRLQEILQARHVPLPDYSVLEITGEAHDQRFKVACHVQGLDEDAVGIGTSRRKAEQEAALHAISMLEDHA